MMEKTCAKEETISRPSVRTSNGDDESIVELNEDEVQQLLQSIDDIMGPGNTDIPTEIIKNQSSTLQELTNTTIATAFVEDFEEFEKSYLPAYGSGDASIDATILQDFEIFEKTMLPPMSHGNMDNVDDGGGGEGAEENMKEMVNEMVDDGNETINFIEEDNDMLTFYFDDGDYDEYDFDFGGIAGSGMDPFPAPQGGTKRVHYIKCSADACRRPENESRRRKKVKRKYRGVIETEEQTAERLAITKIKNREAAVRAYERRREYEACLETQLQKLHWKNKYLKNYIKFLECDNREHMQLQPLRRTRSGLM